MRRRRSSAPLVVAVTIAVVGSACGTRLPDSAFATTVPPTSAASSTSGPSTSTAPNTASDVGVTADEIKVGLIVSATSFLGPDTFSGPMYGAQAYFRSLNEAGGIAGRKVKLVVCDDQSSGEGNQTCVHRLIDDERVFAFAGNSIFDYAGASYVNEQGVPDIAGQPIGSEYDQYPHLFSIYGSSSPRDGVNVGFGGTLYGGTEIYRYFKKKQSARSAAIVAYNQADSLRYARYSQDGLEREGFDVVVERIEFGVPNWDAVVLDMKQRGVDIVFDALENNGNLNLCKAMDRNGFRVKARVVSVQAWTDAVRTDYADAPTCRNSLWSTSNTLNYGDTQYPVVKRFRADMKRAFPDREDKLSIWTAEGWASAQWFADAARSCGADLTRACVETYMNRPNAAYDGDGMLLPRDFTVSTAKAGDHEQCINVARWRDSANDGRGGWVTQVDDMRTNCFEVPMLAYEP